MHMQTLCTQKVRYNMQRLAFKLANRQMQNLHTTHTKHQKMERYEKHTHTHTSSIWKCCCFPVLVLLLLLYFDNDDDDDEIWVVSICLECLGFAAIDFALFHLINEKQNYATWQVKWRTFVLLLERKINGFFGCCSVYFLSVSESTVFHLLCLLVLVFVVVVVFRVIRVIHIGMQ